MIAPVQLVPAQRWEAPEVSWAVSRSADPVAVARLRLHPPAPVPGTETADGVWWPRSLDLVAELGPLLASMRLAGHAVRRVTYNLDAWQPAASKPVINGAVVRLGGYRMLSPRVLHLTSPDSAAPFVLLVIPPSADPVVAVAALGGVKG
ncbi:MAG: hypothetical protein QOI82_1070 [Actinomycetota bacterium]|jgi:hypothetical protein|nr:hypothetical protein [Actinomycetota bacterium]